MSTQSEPLPRQQRRAQERAEEKNLQMQNRALTRGERVHARVMFLLQKYAELEGRLARQEQANAEILKVLQQRGFIQVQTEGGVILGGAMPSAPKVPSLPGR
jgi:hypothetical protein